MKLQIYRGLEGEKVPKNVTHVIVHESVTSIKHSAFLCNCAYLLSVVMGDNVKRIEANAFSRCGALRFIRLSKTLEYIGDSAFFDCRSLEALFLPSTVKWIGRAAFSHCRLLRLLILPDDINLSNVGRFDIGIIGSTNIYRIAENAGVSYQAIAWSYDRHSVRYRNESNRRVNEWLFHHMDDAPFHKLCYNSSITTRQINDYLIDNDNDSALTIDPIHGMTPLHILSMNPHAPADAIAALLNSNMEALFRADNHQKSPLEYARDYNVRGLLEMINSLCSHRNSLIQNSSMVLLSSNWTQVLKIQAPRNGWI